VTLVMITFVRNFGKLVAALATPEASLFVLCFFALASVRAVAETGDYLSLESLAMPRQQIGRAMEAPAIRIYNQRGAVAFREMSVTGLGQLLFPPTLKGDYRFNLSFREESTGALIQDIQDENGDPLYFNQNDNECDNMGAFRGDPGWSLMLISQDALWQPNLYTRTGTFHKYVKGKLISFGVVDRTSISTDADEVYEEFEITNRLDRVLVLTVVPDQYSKPRGPCFMREDGKNVICAVSDLGTAGTEGWRMEIPAKGKCVGRVGLLVLPKGTPGPPGYQVADLAQRIEHSKQATREELNWAAKQLPQFYSENKQIEEFYKRSILTVLNCRMNRTDGVSQPYYMSGPGSDGCWAWDTSFASEMLATMDPEGLKKTVCNFFRGGQCFRVTNFKWNQKFDSTWNGKLGGYIQNPFAMIQMVSDYIRLTGDKSFLDEKIDDRTIFQYLKQAAISLRAQYARPDGLLDIGGGTKKMLEIRTSGYEDVIATINGLAAGYFRKMAEWCKDRSDSDADQFQVWSNGLFKAIDSTLWNDEAGWYANILPDGSKNLVLSYHMLDLLDEPGIPKDHKLRMIQGIRDGEFLGPYGMFSIARSDSAHWDREDCDWGGGGSYVGQPLRIAEALYRLDPDKAWEVLSHCARWVEAFPYFPQTIYADELALQPHQMDWPLQISGGGGVQAVIFGLFGIQPMEDGSITISPHYNKSLGKSKLTGYRFRGHIYDIMLNPTSFEVHRDGTCLGAKPYRDKVVQR
jgi:hypothetical protein